jgi:eukaryotic-like serine/threonine-protein kinase
MVQTLGDYNILERTGADGLGETYRARDTRRGRTVAIHVVESSIAGDPDRRERLLADARAAAALSHPNIAALYEIAEDRGHLFLASEFVPGETLKHLIAGQPVNTRHALDIAIQVADALAEGHAANIMHRDINTETVIVTPKGNAKVLDFGLSAWTGRTVSGYQSPEQALGDEADGRSDLFSLGAVMFEMLTGRPAFAGATPDPLAPQVVQRDVPAPSSVNPSLPQELDPVVAKAVEKRRDQRAESAALFAAELRTIAAMLDVRSEAAEAANPPKAARQRSFAGWVFLLAVLATLAAAGWWRWGG